MWIRDAPARGLDHLALTAMCDSFFPRAFLRLGRPVPAGTVTLTIHFLATADEIALKLGIAPDSAQRVGAAMAEVLREATAAVMDAITAELEVLRGERPPEHRYDPRRRGERRPA